MWALFKFMLKHGRMQFLAAALFGAFSGLANARLISIISDHLASLQKGDAISGMPFLLAATLALTFGISTRLIIIRLSMKLIFNLRINMSRKIMEMSLRQMEKTGFPRLLAAFSEDIPTLAGALLQIPVLLINATITLGCLVYLGFLSTTVLIIFLVFMVVSIVCYRLPEYRGIGYLKQARQAWNELYRQFTAMIEGAKELKLHYRRSEAFFNRRLFTANQSVRRATYAHQVLYSWLDSWAQLLYFIFIGILLFLLPLFQPLDLRTITGFTLVVLFMRGHIITAVHAIPEFRKARIAFDQSASVGLPMDPRAYEDAFADKQEVTKRLGRAKPANQIRLEAVTYRFQHRDEKPFTLGPVDLTLTRGQAVFLVGGNGCGKTTLAKVICGLYLPQRGRIFMDDQRVTHENRLLYRENFSAIFDDFYIFEELLGLENPQLDETARCYLETLKLSGKITIENGRLSTTSLSTGQRKRLALLTAYLEDRPIYVFDEWAADQDPEFKKVFYLHLLPELTKKNKLVVVISHDDRYFHVADQLVKLTDGAVTSIETKALGTAVLGQPS